MVTEIKNHCWKEGPQIESRENPGVMVGTTCMLPDGHDGDHEGVRNDEITITFADGNKP